MRPMWQGRQVMEHSPGVHEDRHPGPRTYTAIGAILAVITAIEVWAFFWTFLTAWLLTMVILLLSLVKFVLVVGYFMHLRFDDRRFMALFAVPFIIALFFMIALLALFQNLTR
jgi:cytochrome c oxidase subunit 4